MSYADQKPQRWDCFFFKSAFLISFASQPYAIKKKVYTGDTFMIKALKMFLERRVIVAKIRMMIKVVVIRKASTCKFSEIFKVILNGWFYFISYSSTFNGNTLPRDYTFRY